MSDLPPELRDRAARAALETFHSPRHPYYTFDTTTESYRQAWREIVDAVAGVLAEHLKKHCLNCNSEVDPLDQMLEIDYSRPAQRVAIELVELREENKRLRAGPAGAHPAGSED